MELGPGHPTKTLLQSKNQNTNPVKKQNKNNWKQLTAEFCHINKLTPICFVFFFLINKTPKWLNAR